MQSEPRHARTSVWALSISLAATLEIDFSFSSSGYLDVSVPRVPFLNLCIQLRMTRVFLVGFPHSDISGSMDICSSPKLFAAYHVFHRLPVPRHSPYALSVWPIVSLFLLEAIWKGRLQACLYILLFMLRNCEAVTFLSSSAIRSEASSDTP